jgi:hypothetical protein
MEGRLSCGLRTTALGLPQESYWWDQPPQSTVLLKKVIELVIAEEICG